MWRAPLKSAQLIETQDREPIKVSVYKCQKTGIRVVHRQSPSRKLFFAIGFPTPAQNDCGITHIIEHSLFAGNQQFRDFNIANYVGQCAMLSLINATTYPDKTVYFAETSYAEDIPRILDVLLPACFAPQFMYDPEIFYQEGYKKEDSGPGSPGVVYNEMSSILMNPLRVLIRKCFREIYRDSHQRFESGGIPASIAETDWDMVRDYYLRHYHPENMIIYLSGNCSPDAIFEKIGELKIVSQEEQKKPLVLSTDEGWWQDKIQKIAIPRFAKESQSLAVFFNLGAWGSDNLSVARSLRQLLLSHPTCSIPIWIKKEGLAENVNFSLLQDLGQIIVLFVFNGIKDPDHFRERFYQDFFKELGLSIADESLKNQFILDSISREAMQSSDLDLAKIAVSALCYGLSVADSLLAFDTVQSLSSSQLRAFQRRALERFKEAQTSWFTIESVGESRHELEGSAVVRLPESKRILLQSGPKQFIECSPKRIPYLDRRALASYRFQAPSMELTYSQGRAIVHSENDEQSPDNYWLYWDVTGFDGPLQQCFGLFKYFFRALEPAGRKGSSIDLLCKLGNITLTCDIKTIPDQIIGAPKEIFCLKFSVPKNSSLLPFENILALLRSGVIPVASIPLLLENCMKLALKELSKSPSHQLVLRNLSHLTQGSYGSDAYKGLSFHLWFQDLARRKDYEKVDIFGKSLQLVQSILSQEPILFSSLSSKRSLQDLMKIRDKLWGGSTQQEDRPQLARISLQEPEDYKGHLAQKEAFLSEKFQTHTAQSIDLSSIVGLDMEVLRALNMLFFQPYVWRELREKGRAYEADSLITAPGYLTVFSVYDPDINRTSRLIGEMSLLRDIGKLDSTDLDRICISGIKRNFVFYDASEYIERYHFRFLARKDESELNLIAERYKNMTADHILDCWKNVQPLLGDPAYSVLTSPIAVERDIGMFEKIVRLSSS